MKKCVVKKDISFENYKECVLNGPKGPKQYRSMNRFRSEGHQIYTEKINKIALSADDDKRVIMDDGIHTVAHGHWMEYK